MSVNVQYLNPEDNRPAVASNRSSWLVNIGTHKLPANKEEDTILVESLSKAIMRLFKRKNFKNGCFIDLDADEISVARKIKKITARFSIEHGTKTGRIDSHIILDVKHNTRLRFNHVRFGELLDLELKVENETFIRDGLTSGKRIEKNRPLQWADGKVYVSFRSIGGIQKMKTEEYIRKTFAVDKTFEQRDTDMLVNMAETLPEIEKTKLDAIARDY